MKVAAVHRGAGHSVRGGGLRSGIRSGQLTPPAKAVVGCRARSGNGVAGVMPEMSPPFVRPRSSLTQLSRLHRGHGETPDSVVVKLMRRRTYTLAAWDSLPVNRVTPRRNQSFRLCANGDTLTAMAKRRQGRPIW